MMDWLCRAFGFEVQAAYRGADGAILHAQLTRGDGMLMLSQVNAEMTAAMLRQPDEAGGIETQCPYLVVDDCDAVYAQAKAAGAIVVQELNEQSYGGKSFRCTDPEGHQWNVGSYNPWAPDPAA
jgi:uncharacterized glyoxalase superfamily protein PhnB